MILEIAAGILLAAGIAMGTLLFIALCLWLFVKICG